MRPRADARNYEIDGQWPSGKAAPLADWELPEAFLILRRLMEARMGKKGKREFVQVLRLLETFRIADVDAVKHLVLCRIDAGRPGWTWRFTRTCQKPMSQSHPQVITWRCYQEVEDDGYASPVAGPSSEGPAPADFPA